MFNIGFSELVILGIIALIFIGPKELPEIARVLGRFINDLKRTTSDLTSTMMESTDEIRKQLKEMRETLDKPLVDESDFGYKEPPSDHKTESAEQTLARMNAAPTAVEENALDSAASKGVAAEVKKDPKGDS